MLDRKRSRTFAIAAALILTGGAVCPHAPFLSYDFEHGRLDDFLSPRDGAALILCGTPDLYSTGPVRAEATCLHRGRRTMVWQTRITDAGGRLLSLTIQTQMVLMR